MSSWILMLGWQEQKWLLWGPRTLGCLLSICLCHYSALADGHCSPEYPKYVNPTLIKWFFPHDTSFCLWIPFSPLVQTQNFLFTFIFPQSPEIWLCFASFVMTGWLKSGFWHKKVFGSFFNQEFSIPRVFLTPDISYFLTPGISYTFHSWEITLHK